MKTGRFILYLSTLFTLSSCDPYGGYEYWIQNESDSTLLVAYSSPDNDSIQSEIIRKGEEIRILQFDTNNGLNDVGIEDLFELCDSVSIRFDLKKPVPVKKILMVRENWTYEPIQTSALIHAGDNIYTFTIKNEDLK